MPEDRGLGLVAWLDDSPLPDGYVIPEPYIVASDGVHLMKDDGAKYARVAWSWLFPIRVYVDPDGDQLVELAWRDGPRWVTRLIRRSLTKSGRKLVTEVGDACLPVIDAEAKEAERWLAAAEAANRGSVRPAFGRPATRMAGRREDIRHRARTPPGGLSQVLDQAAALAAHRPQAPSPPGKTPSRRPVIPSVVQVAGMRDWRLRW